MRDPVHAVNNYRPHQSTITLSLHSGSSMEGGDNPGGSIAAAHGLTKDEESSSSVKVSIIEDEDDEAEVGEDEYTDLSDNKEEEDISGEPEASSSADTTILFVKGEEMGNFIPVEPFGLVINLNCKDLNSYVFQDAIFNQTVTIIERKDGLDGETIFVYMFLAGLGLLVAVDFHQLLESRKRKRPIQKVEMDTSSQNDVDMSWSPQETLN
ncbi:translocon-associated protein subunit alpha-like [Glossophaga mutica]